MLRGLSPLCIRVHRPSPVGAHAMHVTRPSAAACSTPAAAVPCSLLFAPCSLLLTPCCRRNDPPVGWFLTPRSQDKRPRKARLPARLPSGNTVSQPRSSLLPPPSLFLFKLFERVERIVGNRVCDHATKLSEISIGTSCFPLCKCARRETSNNFRRRESKSFQAFRLEKQRTPCKISLSLSLSSMSRTYSKS